jgi:hypothetical protein
VSAMATREYMLAEEARREFRSAKAAVRALPLGTAATIATWFPAYDAVVRTWHRWELAARAAGLDPSTEAPDWLPSAGGFRYRILRYMDTFSDLYSDGWRAVQHETVPSERRGPLLAILGCGADFGGGVFVKDDAGTNYGLVVFAANPDGRVRQDIAIEVPICTHEVPLAEGCSVCSAGALP